MNRRAFIASGSLVAVAAPLSRTALTTRAEASAYRETSSLADIERFIAALDERGAPIVRGSIGPSLLGRDIPIVVASRPRIETPRDAHALGRPIVLVVASIDASHVEGKEALLAIVRDFCLSTQKTMLEDLVLVFVPVLDVDGNDTLGPVEVNAADQNGPPLVGTRRLIEDFARADAPETRAILHAVRVWQPHVVIDLGASDGSFHRFGATYASARHAAAIERAAFVRDDMLPAVRREMHDAFAIETFGCGHFGRDDALPEPPPPGDAENFGWFADGDRPRRAVDAFGLDGRLAVHVAAFAHDPLQRRIFATRAFVETILGFCTDRAASVLTAAREARHWTTGSEVPLVSTLATEPTSRETIAWENLTLARSDDPEPGVPAGFRRTGTFSSALMPVYGEYVGAKRREAPARYLVFATSAPAVVPFLDAHGIWYRRSTTSATLTVRDFIVESAERSEHRRDRGALVIGGRWRAPTPYVSQPGDVLVPGGQPSGPLLSLLIEPESEDGLFAWNVFGDAVGIGMPAPVLHVLEAA